MDQGDRTQQTMEVEPEQLIITTGMESFSSLVVVARVAVHFRVPVPEVVQ